MLLATTEIPRKKARRTHRQRRRRHQYLSLPLFRRRRKRRIRPGRWHSLRLPRIPLLVQRPRKTQWRREEDGPAPMLLQKIRQQQSQRHRQRHREQVLRVSYGKWSSKTRRTWTGTNRKCSSSSCRKPGAKWCRYVLMPVHCIFC